jgi:hypothetical protein
MEASRVSGREESHTSPFTLAAITFLASPSLIDRAISWELVPSGYSRTAPSGNVIFIMLRLSFKGCKINKLLPDFGFDKMSKYEFSLICHR